MHIGIQESEFKVRAMEMRKVLTSPLVLLAALLVAALARPPLASADIATACTTPLVTSFSPCLFYLTGGGSGVWSSSPADDCCEAFGRLIRSSAECSCLILTGNVPFGLPINWTLAINLPSACKSDSIPLRCKGTATPLPPPGPVPFAPGLPPFRNWTSLSPPLPSLPPRLSPPLPAPRTPPAKRLPPAPASAPSASMQLASWEELRQLDPPTSGVETSSIYLASFIVPMAIGATLMSRF